MLARSVNSLRRAVMLQRPSGIACLATAAGPEPPTRPTPAYARFAKAKYQATMAALPEGSTSKDAFRDIGRQWQAASDAELDVYFDEFQKESDQYKSAVESFLAAGGDPASLKRKSPKGKRVKRDPTKPKRVSCALRALQPPPSLSHPPPDGAAVTAVPCPPTPSWLPPATPEPMPWCSHAASALSWWDGEAWGRAGAACRTAENLLSDRFDPLHPPLHPPSPSGGSRECATIPSAPALPPSLHPPTPVWPPQCLNNDQPAAALANFGLLRGICPAKPRSLRRAPSPILSLRAPLAPRPPLAARRCLCHLCCCCCAPLCTPVLPPPPQAMTTWTAFVKHYMNSVKKPEVKVTEAMKAASVAFKALPAAELAAFERQADEDAARYSQEMAQWTTAQEADERA